MKSYLDFIAPKHSTQVSTREEKLLELYEQGALSREFLSMKSSESDLAVLTKAIARKQGIDFASALDVVWDGAPSAPPPSAKRAKADFSMDNREEEKRLAKEAHRLAQEEGIDFAEAVNRLLPDEEEDL